jgi:hypothetical protein
MAKKRAPEDISPETELSNPIKVYQRTLKILRMLSDLEDTSMAALMDKLVQDYARGRLHALVEEFMRDTGMKGGK